MEFIVVLVIAFVAYIYLSPTLKKGKRTINKSKRILGTNSSSKIKTTFIPKTRKKIEQEIKAITKRVKTIGDIETLEAKIVQLEEKYHYEEDEAKSENINESIGILRLAAETAYDKPYKYYYDYEPDVDTELKELMLIGKTLTPKQYDELDSALQNRFCAVSFDYMDNAVELASECLTDEVQELIVFRKIVESDLPIGEKAKKFNDLVSKSQDLLDELDLDDKPELEEYDNEFDASLYGQYLKRFEN